MLMMIMTATTVVRYSRNRQRVALIVDVDCARVVTAKFVKGIHCRR